MADNVAVTAGSGTIVAADEVTDGTLGTVKVQYVKQMDGALNGTNKAGVNAAGGALSAPAPVTPAAGTASAIVQGGAALIIVTGPVTGGYIVNPPNLASQGIGAQENLYVDPVAAPGSTDTLANGTTRLLLPGDKYDIPPLAAGQVIRANAATSGHKMTVVTW